MKARNSPIPHANRSLKTLMNTRNLITRIKEHFTRNGPSREHGKNCGSNGKTESSFDILDRTNREIVILSVLEALHIREVKPTLNTKD